MGDLLCLENAAAWVHGLW